MSSGNTAQQQKVAVRGCSIALKSYAVIVVFLFGVSLPRSTAQLAKPVVQSGTLVVVGYSQSKVVIAADSRAVTADGDYRDDSCKITALNDRLLFTAAGSLLETFHGVAIWDGVKAARDVFAGMNMQDEDVSGDFLDRLAHDWGNDLGAAIGKNMQPKEALALRDRGVLVDGLFIGLTKSEKLHISHQKITVLEAETGSAQISIDGAKIVTLTQNMKFVPIGEGDIFDEFQLTQTPRSKQWHSELRSYRRKHGIADADMARAIFIVYLTEKWGTAMASFTSGIHLVGGDIDAVELKPEGKVRWIQRKHNCSPS